MGDWFEKQTLGSLPRRAAERWGRAEALVFGDSRVDFETFEADVQRAARALIAAGVQPGEKVALWLTNRPSWLHVFFGAARIGAVVVPLNTRLRTHDLDYVLRQSDTGTLVAVDRSGPVDYLEMILELFPELRERSLEDRPSERAPELGRVLIDGERGATGTLAWSELLARADEVQDAEVERRAAAVDPDAPALIMYTSGSTGDPKGVLHSHNLVRNVEDEANRMAITPRDTVLMYLPLFHAFGLYEGALMMVQTGMRMVLQEWWDPELALELLEKERCTLVHGFDTHFNDLMNAVRFESTDRSSLRLGLLPSGMGSTVPVAREVQEKLCHTVSGWGMTEVGVGLTLGFPSDDEDHRCVGSGYTLPGYEKRIVDLETGEVLPPGRQGELQVRGYMIMLGYYKKPEATAASFSADGWFRTGDLCEEWPDGTLRFLGRSKEMLKVGGENVDPFEVEGYLLTHPSVEQVQVVGRPDGRLSEVPVACVIPAEGHTAREEELLGFCRGKLASFKIPREVVIMKEFPMTASGKVQRFRLREQLSQG